MMEIDECNAAMERATKAAERILNEIEDESTDINHSNAVLITMFGYFVGMADTIIKAQPFALPLLMSARAVGREHGTLAAAIKPEPKGAI